MFTSLGRLAVRRRWTILIVTGVALVVAGAVGGDVTSRLVAGGIVDRGSESSKVASIITDEFERSDPNLLFLVTAKRGSVDDRAVADAGLAVARQLAAQPHVAHVTSYWDFGRAAPLRSRDRTQALVLAVIDGEEDEVLSRVGTISQRFTGDRGVVTVGVGGWGEVYRQAQSQVEQDARNAELLAFPLTLLCLLFVFGSVVAAGLPLAVGALAIAGACLVLWLIAGITEVSIFSLNLTTMLGLGLAIDYSLFIVSRFREELHGGATTDEAVQRTVETAGRTVLFSALVLSVSLAAMLVFPIAFLRSFAYAGIAVAAVAAAGAALFLPAVLAVLGPRVDRFRVVPQRRRDPDRPGFWRRAAEVVMHHPLPVSLAVMALLVALGSPFSRIQLAVPDDRVLPPGASSRQVHDEIRANFASQEVMALQVAVPAIDPEARAGDIDAYALALSRVPDVARVDALTGTYTEGEAIRLSGLPPGPLHDQLAASAERFEGRGSTWLSVVPEVEPLSKEGEQLVHAVREVRSPFPRLVGGFPAQFVDTKTSLLDRIPLAGALIALTTFVLLFLMFGSVLVPIKALFINVLSLSATFGAIVWVFQEGHLSGPLHFEPTGSIVLMVPVLMFCVAFGLSMDYEVFLLSRIKEEYDRTGDNPSSVAIGLERTGGIVTAAATLISVVLLSFSTSGVTFVKMFGIGLALAVLMDAFVIRATLVPALMRLAGRANWWAPAPLRRIHERIGISEAPPPEATRREPAGVA